MSPHSKDIGVTSQPLRRFLPDALAAPPRDAFAADFRAEDFPAANFLTEAFRADFAPPRDDFTLPFADFAAPFNDFALPLPPPLTAARDTDAEARFATLTADFDALRAVLTADFDA